MLYGNSLYYSNVYEAPFISGYWIKTIPVSIEIGIAIRINVAWSGINPIGSRFFAEFSKDDQVTWEDIHNGEDCYVYFSTQEAGDKKLYLKMSFETNNPNVIPYYTSIAINIYQMYTAYRLFYDILTSAKLTTSRFWIDPELLKFPIPYSWVKRSSHYDSLKQVIRFCLAKIYVSRNDIIRVEGPNYTPDATIQQVLTPSIYNKKTPLIRSNIPPNEIILYATPYIVASSKTEVYRSGISETIQKGETKIITAIYSVSQNPVINCTASIDGSPDGITIISEEYFVWGAKIKIFSIVNIAFTIVINGYALKIESRIPVAKTIFDTLIPITKGILYQEKLYGGSLYSVHDVPENIIIRSMVYTVNQLLQTYEMAEKIAAIIVSEYAASKKRHYFKIEYPGNPALTLNDVIALGNIRNSNTGNYYVKRHELTFSKSSLKGELLVMSF
ncbi:MAG TPA: hypothetical protein DDW65_21605 [Firmicutes bacterium]|jgi:hypothetical protein|nr:hypothetical protein [Bacillota bacterium]